MSLPRNGFKEYTYQQYIFTLFFAKMDTKRKIKNRGRITGNKII